MLASASGSGLTCETNVTDGAPSRPSRNRSERRASIDLPFASGGAVAAEPVRVAMDADDAELETARKLVQERLNAATARAERLAARAIEDGGHD